MITKKELKVRWLTPEERRKPENALPMVMPQCDLCQVTLILTAEQFLDRNYAHPQAKEHVENITKEMIIRNVYSNILERRESFYRLKQFVQASCPYISFEQIEEMFKPLGR